MKTIHKHKSASNQIKGDAQGKVYLTGQQGRGRNIVQCYICKRTEGNSLVYVVQRGKRSFLNAVKLNITWVATRVFGVQFHYPLCEECGQLVSSILRVRRRSSSLMKRAVQEEGKGCAA